MDFPERTLKVLHLNEPELEFGHLQKTQHPKDGLFLYGPRDKGKKIKEIRLGVIGTPTGINHFKTWSEKILNRINVPAPGKGEKADRLHLANFPGLEEAFGVTFDPATTACYPLDEKELDRQTRVVNHYEAVSKTVRQYVERVRKHIRDEESAIDVWVLIVPEFVYERCRPNAKRIGVPMERGDFGKKQAQRSNFPLLAKVLDETIEEIFDDAPDFHRQIKASFLNIAPTQILRETTIAPEAYLNKMGYPIRRTQDQATVAWNLATGLYYKSQPTPPWKLFGIRPGVCYVGLVYKKIPNDPNGHACCAAQMFLSEGDGVVFRGANGPWQTAPHEFHLKPYAAKQLIQTVLDTYATKHGGPPRELFIHGQTHFRDDEWDAIEAAVPTETNVVGVRIRTTNGETKLFRDGDYPVLRGTALLLDDRNANLWTNGYIPQLDTYIGPETPNPLFITILRSKKKFPSIEAVLTDILSLTKINYNSCNFNDGLPVTVRFARMVGDVLTLGSAKGAEKQPFKFYV